MSKTPEFHIGFELEGLVRQGTQAEFDRGLLEINRDIDRGTDGSVHGFFNTESRATTEEAARFFHNDRRSGNGIEIRTPVKPLDTGLELLDRILEYLNCRDEDGSFKTNKTCGLHVNVSESKLFATQTSRHAFYARVLTVFPEHHVLKLFSRSTNDYCRPMFAKGMTPDYQEVLGRVSAFPSWSQIPLGRNKYHSCGLPDQNRIEFRCLGNKDYHKRLDRLHEALDIIVTTIHEAYDLVVNPPALEKEAEETSKELKGYKSAGSFAQLVGCSA